jgi:hypothetical protein
VPWLERSGAADQVDRDDDCMESSGETCCSCFGCDKFLRGCCRIDLTIEERHAHIGWLVGGKED